MKKLRWIFMGLLLVSTFVFSENNQSVSDINITTELEVVSKLSEFMGATLTGFTGQVETLITLLGIIITLFISFASFGTYIKIKKLSDSISENRETIQKYKEDIDKEFSIYKKDILDDIKESREMSRKYKEFMNKEFNEYKNYIKVEIKEEVEQQIVYGLDKALQKVQKHAYRKVEHTVDKLTEEIQRRRFFYQGLIYQINQAKKYEYEEVMKEEIELDEKIDKIIKIQAKYNEINNYDIPKLFSKNIEDDVIPMAKKLSDYKNIKHTIQKLLVKVLERDNLNFVQKTQIKDILKEKYDWEEEKGAE